MFTLAHNSHSYPHFLPPFQECTNSETPPHHRYPHIFITFFHKRLRCLPTSAYLIDTKEKAVTPTLTVNQQPSAHGP